MEATLTPAEFYDQLVALAKQAHLSWVVDQVEEAVRFGIPESKSLSIPKGAFLVADSLAVAPAKASRSAKTQFEAVRDYTPTEKARLLVKALQRVAVEVSSIEDSILATLTDCKIDAAVEFFADSESAPPTRFDSASVVAKKSDVDRLAAALDSATSALVTP